MEKAILAQSFRGSGEDYERYRPGFPLDVLRVFLSRPVVDILDLGAGTGKLTRLLEDQAEHVVAVDPSEQMLEQLRRAAGPNVETRQGSAEDIPMKDSAVDLVTVAQAFHWFDKDRACAEIVRVLRPDGVLALLWNTPDETCGWDVVCGFIAHPDLAAIAQSPDSPLDPERLPGLALINSARIQWQENISREHYLRRWMTVSTLIVAEEPHKQELLTQLEAVLDNNPETAGQATLCLRQATEVFFYQIRTA